MKSKYLVLLVLVSVFFSRCASCASIEGMTVKDYKVEKQIGDKIFIKSVMGGKKTNPLWVSNISNENFKEALRKSILESNAFSEIDAITDEDWVLEINLLSVDQPYFGFNLTVKTTIEYKLYDKNRLVFSKIISQSGNATMSDALIGTKRLRLANEISARNNIKEMLQSLKEVTQ
jgi:hypothetical protein